MHPPKLRLSVALAFAVALLAPPLAAQNMLDGLVIAEFQTQNAGTLLDEDGDSSDWVELWNPTAATVVVTGWYLTDDPDDLTKWEFPATTLGVDNYLVVFASGKDRAVTGAELHTDFALNKSGGYLALTRLDGMGGIEIVHDFNPFGAQPEGASFGLVGGASPAPSGYFTEPTPGAANASSVLQGFVSDTSFSVDRGIYEAAFSTTIATDTAGATLIYTLDGTPPSLVNGTQVGATDPETPPSVTLPISATTTLRAMAVKTDFGPTDIDTHSYIFPATALAQSNANVPTHADWGHAGPDYEMDPEIVAHTDPEVAPVADDFKRAPTVSLVMNWDEMFGSGGIYPSGKNVEKATSIEYINPAADTAAPNATKGFQNDGTVQIVGSSSTVRWSSDKLSMRIKFSPDLRYEVFGETRADRFDTLVLDSRNNNVWHYGPNKIQRDRGQYTRDQFPADLQNLMGGLAPEGKHVLLYINGVFWGISELHERPDDNFASEYLGGDNDDYDVIKHKPSTVVNGSSANYNAMLDLSRQDMSVQSNYQAVEAVLHIENFIAYMIANYYVGNTDWAYHNWYASYNRTSPDGRWHYHSWDPEHCMESTTQNVTGKDDSGGPTEVFNNLIANPEFEMLFTDRVHEHFHNAGVLTPTNAAAAYMRRANDVDFLTRLESARWGDNREPNPYTRRDWLANRDAMLGTVTSSLNFRDYFPRRTDIVLNQFISQGWYPNTDPPDFATHGGQVPSGFSLGMTSPDGGTIYYTLDGSDPRPPAPGSPVVDHVLVAEGAGKRGMQPTDNTAQATWFTESFSDASWATGTLGAGYDNGKYNHLIDPAFDISGTKSIFEFETIYLRWEFDVSAPSELSSLTLGVRFDDGYVAYLNGVEIARVNNDGPIGTPLAYNAQATSDQLDEAAAQQFEANDVSAHLGLLKGGSNLLAIHGLNSTRGSSDMLIDAILTATAGTGDAGISPSAMPYASPVPLSTTGEVRARVLSDDGEWSPLTEALFVVGTAPADSGNIVISETHYRPASPTQPEIDAGHNRRGDFEFLELLNTGDHPVDLTSLDFSAGIDFTFAEHSSVAHLDPGARLVIVADQDAFAMRYSGDIPVAGEFQNGTGLNNGGETLTLVNTTLPTGMQTVASVNYGDDAPWPTAPDGNGYSLTLACTGPALDHNDPIFWRASVAIGGSPGTADGELLGDWLATNGLAAGQEATDLDFDGMAAIVEFAQGTDPNAAASFGYLSGGLQTFNVGGASETYQIIEFQRRKGADGVSVVTEISGDLVDWSPAGQVVAFRDSATPGTEIVTIRSPNPISTAPHNQQFIRLRVSAK